MKKTLLLLTLSVGISGFSQTTVYTEDFETGNSFTMNTSDLGAANTNNTWLMNNTYAGGSGTLMCLGIPLNFTVAATPSQPGGITGSPNSNYMHIASQAAISNGINNASYVPADGTCFFAETNFSKMTAPISTTGLTDISFDFWYICGGSADAFGEVYYSLDGGSTWILKQSTLNNTSVWTQLSLTDAGWDNQASILFAFRFVNNTATAGAEPSFSVDQIEVISNPSACTETTSSITETVCDSYTSPSGNYTWTTSNTYMDTIPNAAGCDSVITIDLTVNYATTGTDVQSACDSYTWIDGNTYTASNNTAIHILTNAAGCDSTVTLDLTINNSTTGTDMQTACDSYTWIDGNTYTSDNNTATHTLMNAAGCDSVVTLDLTINTVDPSISQSGIMLTANESGATYAWIDCNTMTLISGETGQSYTATANGDYAGIVTVGNCTDTSACATVNTVGIDEYQQSALVRVYPNPSNGLFSIELSKNAAVEITDLTGKSILNQNYTSGQHNVDLTNYSNGIYLVKVRGSGVVSTTKIIKH